MLSFRKTIAAVALLFLAACSNVSMTPLISANIEDLAAVNVIEVSGRDGQLYSRQLRNRLYVNGMQAPNYDLVSRITVASSSSLSVKGKSSTLKKMTMSNNIELLDRQTGEVVLRETLSAGATFGVVTSYFGQDESERNGRERLVKLLAERTARRVQLYFSSQNS